MFDLTGLGLDPDVKESGSGMPKLGKHKAVILEDEIKDSSSGNGKVMHVKFQIVAGEDEGKEVLDFWNILHSGTETSKVTQKIGQGKLRKACRLAGIDYPPKDKRGLYGKPMYILLIENEYISKTTGDKVKGVKIDDFFEIKNAATTQSKTETTIDVGW